MDKINLVVSKRDNITKKQGTLHLKLLKIRNESPKPCSKKEANQRGKNRAKNSMDTSIETNA